LKDLAKLRKRQRENNVDDGLLENGKRVTVEEEEVLSTLFRGMLESVTRNRKERKIHREKIALIRSSFLPRYVSTVLSNFCNDNLCTVVMWKMV
jgi:hypothetical protein